VVSYHEGGNNTLAWSSGAHCQPLSRFCDASSTWPFGVAGYCSIAAGAFALVAVAAVSLRQWLRWRMPPAAGHSLQVALLFLGSSWLSLSLGTLLLIYAFESPARCVVVDPSGHGHDDGAVILSGRLQDIVRPWESYSVAPLLVAWALLTYALIVVALRVRSDHVLKAALSAKKDVSAQFTGGSVATVVC